MRHLFLPQQSNNGHPHFLRLWMVCAVLGLVVFIEGGVLFLTSAISGPNQQTASVLPAVVIALTNTERATRQLGVLAPNALLAQAAQNAASDMAAKGYFAHVSPDGQQPWHWLSEVGYRYQYAGQNLAVNYDDSSELLSAWMDSPTHRANILGAHFTEIGIGMATGTYQGHIAVFVVQFFASPQEAAAASVQAPVQARVVSVPALTLSPVTSVSITSGTVSSSSVLGTATAVTAAPTATPPIQPTPQNNLTFWQRVLASPRTYATCALTLLAVLFLLILLLSFAQPFAPAHTLHPKAVFNGVALVAVLVGILLVNKTAFFTGSVALPSSDQSASVVMVMAPSF